ncbi:MAG TPA: hypothetical protein VF681_12215 [Abditibacteriaceae bacterium]|jgi:hypothetical protein
MRIKATPFEMTYRYSLDDTNEAIAAVAHQAMDTGEPLSIDGRDVLVHSVREHTEKGFPVCDIEVSVLD